MNKHKRILFLIALLIILIFSLIAIFILQKEVFNPANKNPMGISNLTLLFAS